jgi:hypothetical protein
MSIERPKCKNDLEMVTQLIEVPFADLGITMDKAARERFEYHIIRVQESFFINILYYAYFTDRIIFIAEFPAKCNYSLDKISAKLSGWVSYCSWQGGRSLEKYYEKNAFKASFILGNMLQCFSYAYNRMNHRKCKVSNLYKSMIVEDIDTAWHNLLYDKLLTPFIESLDSMDMNKQSINQEMNQNELYKSFIDMGMRRGYLNNPSDRLKAMIGFIFKFIREELNKTTFIIRESLNKFKDAFGSFIWGKMIASKATIRKTVGRLKCYQLYKGIDIYTLRPITGLKNL